MTPPSLIHLPNGQRLSVTPVFGGLFFKALDLSVHGAFPAGWTITIQTNEVTNEPGAEEGITHRIIHPFHKPTLRNDCLFISSISNPSSSDFKPAVSPTRQIAMMLWTTLYWYFHQPAPPPYLTTNASKATPDAGKPRGDWRVNIRREGVFRGRNLLQKLEAMGLIACEESDVGLSLDDRDGDGWKGMFVSQRAFWQLPARLFLFTLAPATATLTSSRPSSPAPGTDRRSQSPHAAVEGVEFLHKAPPSPGHWAPNSQGHFSTGSHLPTYYPPPPLQFTMTDGVRHPIRPKPPQQGETFYTRYIPSVGQYLSFRTATLSTRPVMHLGPVASTSSGGTHSPTTLLAPVVQNMQALHVDSDSGDGVHDASPTPETEPAALTDLQLLHRWMNDPRVVKAWGVAGPISEQEEFLKQNLTLKHSFPIIAYWDDKPFGYMELYWAKEDRIARYLGRDVGDWDRGIHVLVGEDEFRGRARLHAWVTALIHALFLLDNRTESIFLEPRVDNERFLAHLQDIGFSRDGEVSFPHKHSVVMRFRREKFVSPVL